MAVPDDRIGAKGTTAASWPQTTKIPGSVLPRTVGCPTLTAMHYLGLMSGTSADAIDAVVVEISQRLPCRLVAAYRQALPSDVQRAIHALSNSGADEIERCGNLHTQLGELFADAALAVLAQSGLRATDIQAIGSHGQTLRHRPAGQHPFSLQIGNPSIIAERTGITTVADFRARDLAAGGQGAPLVPAFHAAIFGMPGRTRVILNLGGIANVTCLPANGESITGFDTGPGNTLLDAWVRRHLGQDHDAHGQWAESGRCDDRLLEILLADPYFLAAPPKSTGRELFNLDWLDAALEQLTTIPSAANVQATLLTLTAKSVAHALQQFLSRYDELYVCGGGSHNTALMKLLQTCVNPVPVQTTAALGIDPDWVEACAFAWLAHQTLAGKPGNLPTVTGARHAAILGGIYKA